MTLQQTIDSIDATFPVAGKDNDSQGFRDNFGAIKSALSTANTEVTTLQTNALLAADLTSNAVVSNNLLGSSINNGSYNNFHGVSYITSVSGATDIDITAASIQVFTMSSSASFTFHNWPAGDLYARVKLHFVSNGTGDFTPTLYTTGGGVVKLDDSYPAPLIAHTNAKHQVVEAWSYNSGATVFVKYLGSY